VVLDSSALVAIFFKEPGHERLLEAIEHAELIVVGAPTLLETVMVLTSRLNQDARPLVFAFLRRLKVEIVAFGEQHFDAAATAFLQFGRRRHRAELNFRDCMSYAVASVAGLPLLFTGRDFAQTDIPSAARL
jgi:ribonuclease VapC